MKKYSFGNVKVGEFFYLGTFKFIKIKTVENNVNAVSLADEYYKGSAFYFKDEDSVSVS